jgi:hypothetical protein
LSDNKKILVIRNYCDVQYFIFRLILKAITRNFAIFFDSQMFLDRKSRNARHGWTRQDGALRSGLGRLPSDTLSTTCGRDDLAGLAVYGVGGAGLATITPHAIALMIFRRSSFAIMPLPLHV